MPARERKVQIYIDNALEMDPVTNQSGTQIQETQPSPITAESPAQSKESTIKRLKKLHSTANLYQMSSSEMELKANLYYHISNPIKRWKTDRSPPLMLILQMVKTISIVAQVLTCS